MSIYFPFQPSKWRTLPNGLQYKGAQDENGLPHGLGALETEPGTYYIGDFVHGERHGRGFILTHTTWTERKEVAYHLSYEEVMSTAEFDSCGRVISTGPAYRYRMEDVKMEKWEKSDDGVWEHDHFKHITSQGILHSELWKGAQTAYARHETYDTSGNTSPTHFLSELSCVKATGEYGFNGDAFVSVYDNVSLLVCLYDARVFRLEIGKEVLFSAKHASYVKEDVIYTFTLGPNFRQHIDLLVDTMRGKDVHDALSECYLRAMCSLIFQYKIENRPHLPQYLTAIGERMPEAVIETQADGKTLIRLPHDEWQIWEQPDHTWLHSKLAQNDIRITGCPPDNLTEVLALSAEVLAYAQTKI